MKERQEIMKQIDVNNPIGNHCHFRLQITFNFRASLKKEKEERKRKRGDGNRFWVIVLPPLFSQS